LTSSDPYQVFLTDSTEYEHGDRNRSSFRNAHEALKAMDMPTVQVRFMVQGDPSVAENIARYMALFLW
jgi:hypothetical protein